jgi:hypothetical protein
VKKFSKLLLALLLLGGFVLPMLITGPDGRPLMTPQDWLPDLGQSKAELQGQLTANDYQAERLAASTGKMYKWQDDKGQWHFSEQKPSDAVIIAVEQLPDVENVMDSPSDNTSGSSNIGFPLDQAGELLKQLSDN